MVMHNFGAKWTKRVSRYDAAGSPLESLSQLGSTSAGSMVHGLRCCVGNVVLSSPESIHHQRRRGQALGYLTSMSPATGYAYQQNMSSILTVPVSLSVFWDGAIDTFLQNLKALSFQVEVSDTSTFF